MENGATMVASRGRETLSHLSLGDLRIAINPF